VRVSTYVIGIPVAVAAVAVAVANRETVLVSLDPFARDNAALSVQMPLFLLLFAVFGAGLLLGWIVALWTRPARPPARPGRSLLPWRGRKPKPPAE
jgi:F0F1-type ATP synthase membrane subunit c/vacuolar-type H+-ATPase subunit K